MGANKSQPVELQLSEPQVDIGDEVLFAKVHTEASGVLPYKVWNEPLRLMLWTDDIIIVSIYKARSATHFDKHQFERYAELHVPWDAVRESLEEASEVGFFLGLNPQLEWLGTNASQQQYKNAFLLASREASAPHVHVIVRRLQQVPPMAAEEHQQGVAPLPPVMSPPTSASAAELSAGDMDLLFQLQKQNEQLRQQLGPSAIDMPEGAQIEQAVQRHLDGLRRAMADNDRLKTELDMVERELTSTASLSEADQMLSGMPHGPPPESAANDGDQKQIADVMAEIQRVTSSNMDLIKSYDEQIRSLEVEIATARYQTIQGQTAETMDSKTLSIHLGDELRTIHGECEKLTNALNQEIARKADIDNAIIQRLQVEEEVHLEDIEKLQRELDRMKDGMPLQPPSTGVLNAEVETLRMQITKERQKGDQEQAAFRSIVDDLRQEMRQIEEQLTKVVSEQAMVERDFEEIRKTSNNQSIARELEFMRQQQASLEKEMGRSNYRIQVYDEEIQQLQGQADNVRQRARIVSQPQAFSGAAELANGKSNSEVSNLQEQVSKLQEQLQLAKYAEEEFRRGRDEALKDLHEARAAANVVEQQMNLFESRAQKLQN